MSHPGSTVELETLAGSPEQLKLDIPSRQQLRRGLRSCLGSGMREGGMFWIKEVGETVAIGWGGAGEGLFGRGHDKRDDVDETVEGKAATGDEVRRAGSISSSPHDLLSLRKVGEQSGVPIWITSPSEAERLLLAMELAVGFM